MDFDKEINELEKLNIKEDYYIRIGSVPILFTAPHTMNQKREDGRDQIRPFRIRTCSMERL